MQLIRFSRTTASILILGVLVAAMPTPVVAQPGGDGGRAEFVGLSAIETAVGWLVGLVPAGWLPAGPESARESSRGGPAVGPDLEPDGRHPTGPDTTSGDPTADPELGSGLDPDG